MCLPFFCLLRVRTLYGALFQLLKRAALFQFLFIFLSPVAYINSLSLLEMLNKRVPRLSILLLSSKATWRRLGPWFHSRRRTSVWWVCLSFALHMPMGTLPPCVLYHWSLRTR